MTMDLSSSQCNKEDRTDTARWSVCLSECMCVCACRKCVYVSVCVCVCGVGGVCLSVRLSVCPSMSVIGLNETVVTDFLESGKQYNESGQIHVGNCDHGPLVFTVQQGGQDGYSKMVSVCVRVCVGVCARVCVCVQVRL